MSTPMSEIIVGIDLGTTNSEIAVLKDGTPVVLPDEDGDPIMPSVVGLDASGKLLVGKAARNQFALAPERTIRSIKRKMGQAEKVKLGDREYTPQEISSIILRTLKERAEKALGKPVKKAVITVPAFFTEGQRDATREAGSLAGLEVVRIINEPTAATLAYQPKPEGRERLLVYDLGGGTFDVSIVQIEKGVVEVLASHGDTHLGGDDFDQQLLDYVCGKFKTEHGIELRDGLVTKSRVLHAVEQSKKDLSFSPVAGLAEEFIAEKDGQKLHLKQDVERLDYEKLIETFLARTLTCVDKALDDAKLTAADVDKIILVGGATRTPAIRRILEDKLHKETHLEVEPDLCVALGAAVQAGLVAGMDVGPVLVDITPHTLGIETLGMLYGLQSVNHFSPIIRRNTPLPATRTECYITANDGQNSALIRVFQGEDADTRHDTEVGEFMLEKLQDVAAGNQIHVRFDLDINGILTVTATERMTGHAHRVQMEKTVEKFRRTGRKDAERRLADVWGTEQTNSPAQPAAAAPTEQSQFVDSANRLLARAKNLVSTVHAKDAEELKSMIAELETGISSSNAETMKTVMPKLEDMVFYLEDAKE